MNALGVQLDNPGGCRTRDNARREAAQDTARKQHACVDGKNENDGAEGHDADGRKSRSTPADLMESRPNKTSAVNVPATYAV